MTEESHNDSRSESKYRRNNAKMFGFFYSSILLSIGISVSIYGASTAGYSEKFMAVKIYYTSMYVSSVIIIVTLWIYLFVNRNTSCEALIKGDKGNFEFKFSTRGEKVNLYLRLGLAMFGIGTFIYTCAATYIRNLDTTSMGTSIAHGVSQATFVLIQTIFILFYHRLVPLVHKRMMKFALLHLTITNILLWANASIGKVSFEFETSLVCKRHHIEMVCKGCSYLLPTVSEYTVIAAAVIHEIYLRIGKVSLIELEKKKKKKTMLTQCSKTLPGLIGGTILVFVYIFSSISSIVLHELKMGESWIYSCHSIENIILNILAIIVIIIILTKIRKLKFSVSLPKSSLDKNILFVSYILAINFSFIVAITCGKSVNLKLVPHFYNDLNLRLVSALFEIIQSSLQTHLIIECFQRCSYDKKQKKLKPGKNLLAILLGINFGMWFLWTLQIKNADIIYYKVGKNYTFISSSEKTSFRALLLFFLQSTLPLAMLYRYHSSACLSDIYSKIYQTESERFVECLRAGKIHHADEMKEPQIKHKTLGRNKKNATFDNTEHGKNPEEVEYKPRSQSLGILPISVLKEVKRKIIRRETLKNMEEAQFQFISEQISHQMLQRKVGHDSIVRKDLKEKKVFPTINRMIQQSFFAPTLEEIDENCHSSSHSL